MAGGRTSVSAPLGDDLKSPVPMGRQTARAGNPVRAHPGHRAERAQNPRRGGADLCVRSNGSGSDKHRSMGHPTPWIVTPNPRPPLTAPQGPGQWVAGGRTSVSAPMGEDLKSRVTMGRQTPRAGNPIRAHPGIARQGARTSVAGGRTSVSAPLGEDLKSPVPMGRQTARAGNPIRAIHTPHRKGPTHGSRGGGPLCPLRWTSV